MGLFLGNYEVSPALIHLQSPQTYTCINKSGSVINAGDRVYIASNSNLILITYNKFVKSIGWTGIALETINNNASGKVSATMTQPATGLELYSRVSDCSTVAGFFTDDNNITYAVCVLDAKYRYYRNGEYISNNEIPAYNTAEEALNAKESATYLCSILVDGGWISPGTKTYNNMAYNILRPNATELEMIYKLRNELDQYDPTLSSYSSNSLSGMNTKLVYSCTGSNQQIWYRYNGWKNTGAGTSSYSLGVHILEIPVSNS